jgi:hypothetical protein
MVVGFWVILAGNSLDAAARQQNGAKLAALFYRMSYVTVCQYVIRHVLVGLYAV